MKIIVDGFGGDNAPLEVLRGCAEAVETYGHEIVVTGDEQVLRSLAAANEISLDHIEIVHTTDVITMEDHPKSILREHKECSMAVGLRLLSEGAADAMVSAGSTGALLMGATFIVKRIKGVSRPALAPIMPSDKGPFMLVDSGANAECRPEMLIQFARMGSIYMTELFGNGKPATVGLLNVGTEESKGDELRQTVYGMLRESDLKFIGNVEARETPFGAADVVVADGFSGNVLLKTMEGTVDALMKNIKGLFMTNLATKLAALVIKPYLKGLKKRLDTSEHGGAPVLGVANPVIKAHGNSNAKAIKNAVRVAAEFAEAGVIEKIASALSEAPAEE